MSIRTILLQAVDEPENEARMAFALELAARLGAELTVAYVRPLPIVPIGYGEGAAYLGPEVIEAQREAGQRATERLKASFARLCAPNETAASWQDEEGDPGERLATWARTADLTLTVQSEASGIDALATQVVEQVVMGAGGPVVMLPRGTPPRSLGRRVVAAWNGSREAARALRDAMPFLEAADAVTLVAFGEAAGETVGAAVSRLLRHGVEAMPVRLPEPEGEIGTALLAEAESRGADLLVMGAYGHSRLRELVLGGATREVLATADLPVLMSY